MKVAIINAHKEDQLGGSEVQSDFIAGGLSDRGHEVVYIAPGGGKSHYDTPYKVIPVPRSGRDIASCTINQKPDIVYWRFNLYFFRESVRQIKKAGIPVIFAISGLSDIEKWHWSANHRTLTGKLRRMVYFRWQHNGFRYVDAITSNNKDYIGKIATPLQQYIPNGMSSRKVAFEWERPFIVWISNIKGQKRPEYYVKLAGQFQNKGMDFLMAGKLFSPYKWISDKSRTPLNFYYLGTKTLEEVNGLFAASRFHVHTCSPEGFSNVFIQAWLQGKTSVSMGFDPGGYLRSENIGFYSEDKWDLFVEQVKYLIDHPSDCKSTGEKARLFAEKMFSTDRLTDDIEAFLYEVSTAYSKNKT